MNVGALLDYVTGEIDAQVVGYMQKYAIPASLMDKVLDGIQSHVRQIKSEEYAQELTQLTLKAAEQEAQNKETVETTKAEKQIAVQPIPGENMTKAEAKGLEEFAERTPRSRAEKKTGTIEEFKEEFKEVIEKTGGEENADV